MANNKESLQLQDTDTEAAILGLSMMKGTEVIDIIIENLTEDDFTMPENRMIYTAIRDMFIEGCTKFDEITVYQRLSEKGQAVDAGGRVRLTNLQSKVPYPLPTREETETYITILKDKTLRRNILSASMELQKAALSPEANPFDSISFTEKTLMELSDTTDTKRVDIAETMQESFEFILNMYNGKPPEGSVYTGIKGLDNILVSMNPTDFIILGARPSMGKTAFATNILEHVTLEQNIFTALYSLEMSAEQLGARMILSQSGISSEKIRRGELDENDLICLEDARDKLKSAPLVIDDRAPLDIASIISRSRKLKAEKNLGLIIIDYLQLMTGVRGTDGRQQEVSDISRALKLLAKELRVPVIALSQLNRSLETRNDKRPQMSDLRESGALEQDADIIMFLYRDDYYHPDTEDKGITEVIVAKHRNGALGTAKMFFSKETTHFYDLMLSEEEMLKKPAPERQKSLFKEDNKKDSQQPTEQAIPKNNDTPPVIEEPSAPPTAPATEPPPVLDEPPTVGEMSPFNEESADIYF